MLRLWQKPARLALPSYKFATTFLEILSHVSHMNGSCLSSFANSFCFHLTKKQMALPQNSSLFSSLEENYKPIDLSGLNRKNSIWSFLFCLRIQIWPAAHFCNFCWYKIFGAKFSKRMPVKGPSTGRYRILVQKLVRTTTFWAGVFWQSCPGTLYFKVPWSLR